MISGVISMAIGLLSLLRPLHAQRQGSCHGRATNLFGCSSLSA